MRAANARVTVLPNPKNKFGAVKTTVDGWVFDSKREAARFRELQLLEKAGQITALTWDKTKLRFALIVNGVNVGRYTGDFQYTDAATGKTVLEDTKGVRTRDYVLRKKLMLALYGIEIKEL